MHKKHKMNNCISVVCGECGGGGENEVIEAGGKWGEHRKRKAIYYVCKTVM